MGYLTIAFILAALDLSAVWSYRLLRASRKRPQSAVNPNPRKGACERVLVSYVVPAWNEGAVVSDCLRRVSESRDSELECIVVAGGHDNTFELAQKWSERDPRIRTVPQRDKGLGAALNDGISLSKGDIVVWLSADTVIREDSSEQIRTQFQRDIDILLPDFLPVTETKISLKIVVDSLRAHTILGKTDLSGGAIAFRRNEMEKLLPFPEDIETAIDWDLGKRAQKLGFSVQYWRNSGIRTELPSTLGDYFDNSLRWRRSELRWMIRNWRLEGRLGDCASLVPWLMAIPVLGFVACTSVLYALGFASVSLPILSILVLFWNTLRNATPPAEMTVYDHNWRWASILPTTMLLYIADMLATLTSLATFRRRMWDFKGSRSHRTEA